MLPLFSAVFVFQNPDEGAHERRRHGGFRTIIWRYFCPYPTDKQRIYIFFVVVQQPKLDLRRHDAEISRLNIIIYMYSYTFHTHTSVSTPLIEWSALRRGCYLCNTKQTQEKNFHAIKGIRTRDPSNQAAAARKP